MKYSIAIFTLGLLLGGCSSPNPADQTSHSVQGAGPGVILLRYKPGSESTEQREEGFLEALQEYSDIRVLSSDQYAGTSPEESLDKSQQMLRKYGADLAGVFCVCEPNATGMLGALDDMGLSGKVKFVGFDPTPPMVSAIADGRMDGIVLQDPVLMGYLAVKTMYEHLRGVKVEPRISTGEYVATPENMNTDEMQKLLNPEQFSGEEFQPEEKRFTIAVIPKGTTHEFWKAVHAGARNAARELGDVEIRWKGPITENDDTGQINVVQEFISQRVDGICLAPNDSQALINVVREARDNNIPTVIFDSDLADDHVKVSYVATDNRAGGALAAHRLAEVLGVKRAPKAEEQASDE